MLLLQVHKLCQASAPRILDEFKPNLMIAIGGGGYVPARILRWGGGSARTRVSDPVLPQKRLIFPGVDV